MGAAANIAVMAGPQSNRDNREAAYAEFLASRGQYPRAAEFLDSDRRGEIEHDETDLDERLESHQRATRQPEPAQL